MKSTLVNLVLALCFIVGLVLIFINPIQNYLVAKTSAELIPVQSAVVQSKLDSEPYSESKPIPTPKPKSEPAQLTPVAPVKSEPVEVSFDFEEVQSLTIWDVLKAQASKKNLSVIGSIHIPEVDMTLPILKGVGESSLIAGAGTMKPEQQMGEGNYALASHYIEGKNVLFGPLYHLKQGDSIFLTDLDYMYEYKTTLIAVIEATDVQVIDDVGNQTLLTLITCTENGSKRLLVQAEFVERTVATP